MKSQLKRVDGEVTAMSKRIKALDENLELSESYIRTATTALAEAVQLEVESRKESQEEEEENDALSQFEMKMKLLEEKLAQAKLLAEEARQLDLSGVWNRNDFFQKDFFSKQIAAKQSCNYVQHVLADWLWL